MKKKKTPKKVQKKNNLRARTKNPGLKPHLNLRSRQDLLEIDYLDKLNDKEKDWLNRFNEEYVGANFKHEGKILHKTKKLKKDCYDRNNSRNRDILTKIKASGEKLEELTNYTEADLDPIDKLILLEKFNNLDSPTNGTNKSQNPPKKKN